MKKLMLAAAVVAVAAVTQAGTASWASGTFYMPNTESGHEGELTTTKVNTSTASALSAYVWESFTASDVAFNAGDLYAWYAAGASSSEDPFGGALTAVSGSGAVTLKSSTTTGNLVGQIADAAGTKTAYGAILYVLTDADNNVWYMENSASVAMMSGDTVAPVAKLANLVGGSSGTKATTWTAVPEPTSGLLLLLGVAGLALRRRRA